MIKSSNYQRDSGAYKCQAKNVVGNSEDIAMVYIQKPNRTENHCKTKTFLKILYELSQLRISCINYTYVHCSELRLFCLQYIANRFLDRRRFSFSIRQDTVPTTQVDVTPSGRSTAASDTWSTFPRNWMLRFTCVTRGRTVAGDHRSTSKTSSCILLSQLKTGSWSLMRYKL